MSRVAVQGNVSGTGTLTVAAPNTNTDRTLTLPDQTGELMATGGGPINVSTSAADDSVVLDANGNLLAGATSGPSTYTRVYAYSAAGQDDNNGIIQAGSGSNSASVIAKTPIGTTQLFQWDTYGPRIGSRAVSGANGGTLYWTAGNDIVGASLTADRSLRVGNVAPGSSGSAFTIYGTSGGDIVQMHQNRNSSTPYWYFNTSGGYGVFSDARLKTNIEPLAQADAINLIKNIRPVEFNWTAEAGDTSRRISGFLAQEVLANATTEGQKNILTHWETYDENDPDCPKMGLSDHRLLPSMVGTIQHLLAKVEEQQAALTSLTARIEALEAQV